MDEKFKHQKLKNANLDQNTATLCKDKYKKQ